MLQNTAGRGRSRWDMVGYDAPVERDGASVELGGMVCYGMGMVGR